MYKKIKDWTYAFIELQLIIYLLSLPILITWGLAVSSMSILANLLFTPLLSLFLIASCIGTLCTVLCLPTYCSNIILDAIAFIWHTLLSYGKSSWLIGFPQTFLWLCIPIAIWILCIYSYKRPSRHYSVLLLIGLSIGLYTARYILQKNVFDQIEHYKLYVMRINNKTYMIDCGGLTKKQNIYNFIDYTVLPHLIKKAGITRIDTLVLYKPHKKLLEIVPQLVEQTNIKTIFIHESLYESIQKIVHEYDFTETVCIAIKKGALTTPSLNPSLKNHQIDTR